MNLPFNPRNPATQKIIAAVLVLLIVMFATDCARAGDSYMQFGAGSAVKRGATPSLNLTTVLPDVVDDADVEIGATLIGESTYAGEYQRNNFALHATIVEGLRGFEAGLGAAYLQNIDAYNGSHLNFHLLLGYRFSKIPLTVRIQHFSNAGTRLPNLGRDMALFIYRF